MCHSAVCSSQRCLRRPPRHRIDAEPSLASSARSQTLTRWLVRSSPPPPVSPADSAVCILPTRARQNVVAYWYVRWGASVAARDSSSSCSLCADTWPAAQVPVLRTTSSTPPMTDPRGAPSLAWRAAALGGVAARHASVGPLGLLASRGGKRRAGCVLAPFLAKLRRCPVTFALMLESTQPSIARAADESSVTHTIRHMQHVTC